MKYSVVIPLFNKKNYVQKAIRSVLEQTYDDYEIIIVDDGSTDNSLNSVKEICSDKIKIISQTNQGVSVARNVGIINASGEYIAFLDADDEWHPDYLYTISDLINKYSQCDIFVTSYRVVMSNNKVNFPSKISEKDCCIDSYWTTYQYAYDIVWTSATVVRKKAIVNAGMFTPYENIGQDLDMWARIAKNNKKIAYSPHICVDYNRSAENNARERIKIAYPKSFLNILKEEMEKSCWTINEKENMLKKYNKKMIVYVFTTILSGNRKGARKIIRDWKISYPNNYIYLLYILSFTPNFINKIIYDIRLRIF